MANEAKVKFLQKKVDEVGRRVKCVLGNGVCVELGLDELKPEIVTRLALHGLSQKLGDSAASFSKEENFHGAFGAMQGTADNLLQGVWAAKGSGGTSDLAQAIAELQDVEIEEAEAAIARMDEDTLKIFKSHPEIKLKIAEIQKARLAAQVDKAPSLSDMFAKLAK